MGCRSGDAMRGIATVVPTQINFTSVTLTGAVAAASSRRRCCRRGRHGGLFIGVDADSAHIRPDSAAVRRIRWNPCSHYRLVVPGAYESTPQCAT